MITEWRFFRKRKPLSAHELELITFITRILILLVEFLYW